MPVINLDEVLIPGNHLYFLVLCDELLVLCNHFLSVTNLDEVLIPGNHLHFLVSSDEFPDQILFVFVNDFLLVMKSDEVQALTVPDICR